MRVLKRQAAGPGACCRLDVNARLRRRSYELPNWRSIRIEGPAIHNDFTLGHVTQHGPVETRFICAASFRLACPTAK